jgi:YbbR domain-containing protein
MTSRDAKDKTWLLRALSLMVALLIWLFVAAERDGEMTLQVPVAYHGLSQGLVLVGKPPDTVTAVVRGPRILLMRLGWQPLRITLDLRGIATGKTVFPAIDRILLPGTELRTTRIYPAEIEVTIAATEKP